MKICIVGMIYKSISYLDFLMYNINKYCTSEEYDVSYKIIANDANEKVIEYIKKNNINHMIYYDNNKEDYYLNRIYRAWNYGGFNIKCDVIIFVNSDMAFSPNWIDNLIKKLNKDTIPCSRLVESTKKKSGKYAIEKNFGQNSKNFNEKSFLEYCKEISINKTEDGGLYMPCAFYKKDFIESGGYPEGNIYTLGVGKYTSGFVMSGDDYFFHHNELMKQKRHITVFNSIVYHIQEGELDE